MDDEVVSYAEKFFDEVISNVILQIEKEFEGDLTSRLGVEKKSDFEKGYLFALIIKELGDKFGMERVKLSSKEDLDRLGKILTKIKLATFE